MRYPKHIILDITKPVATNMDIYWPHRYSATLSRDDYFGSSLNMRGSFPNSLKSRPARRASTTFLITSPSQMLQPTEGTIPTRSTNLLLRLFDVNFLKREKLYTKLKYSRSPAYDIVSGGVAALFSGFIGFLISEKFGIELVDSGDFYTFFMYLVFIGFSLRPLVKIMSKETSTWLFISPKFILSYFSLLATLLIRSAKQIFTQDSPRQLSELLKSFYIPSLLSTFVNLGPLASSQLIPFISNLRVSFFRFINRPFVSCYQCRECRQVVIVLLFLLLQLSLLLLSSHLFF